MNLRQNHIIQFVCMTGALTAIMLQGFTHAVNIKPLEGIVAEEKETGFNFKTYLDGSLQDYLAERARRNTGFREFFIRNYNQICYSCFGKVNNVNVIEGKNGALFTQMYLDDITGQRVKDYFGTIDKAKAVARENVNATVQMMDTLKQHGTDFLFVFAPSKTTVYTEHIPKPYCDHLSDFSLSKYYIELFEEHHIPCIDFDTYFKQIKGSSPYPLYSPYGTHWAFSTIPMVSDTIFRMMEAVSGKQLPSTEITDLNITTDYYGQDRELEGQLNLMFPLSKPAIPNPKFILTDTLGKDKPNLVVVADSYFVTMENSCFLQAFDHWSYWKYNDEIISSDPKYLWQTVQISPETCRILEDADIVMAVFTAPMLYDYMFGFPKTVLDLFALEHPSEEETLEKTMQLIRDNPEWYDAIVKQAETLGITTEENLRQNAIYFIKSKETQVP